MPVKSRVLNAEELAQVEALASVLNSEQIADYFGISRRTFYDIMNRQPEVAARYKRGKAKAIGVVAEGLLQKARNGDTTCMIFYLKTQAGWKEGVDVNVGGQAENPVRIQQVTVDPIEITNINTVGEEDE